MRFLPGATFAAVAGTLVVLGAAMLVVALRGCARAYNRNQLVASGIFALVRHPIYSAWIVSIVPGLALLSRSWPMLLTPLVAYIAFKRLIHHEDEDLERQFGDAYLNYRARVNELFPIPRP
jgi:protein-S-isoprenylcysteine O-methyltransferase Ste14